MSVLGQVLGVAAAVEKGCRHPLAEAIVHKTEKISSVPSDRSAEDLRTVPGMGASAKVRRKAVHSHARVIDPNVSRPFRGVGVISFNVGRMDRVFGYPRFPLRDGTLVDNT